MELGCASTLLSLVSLLTLGVSLPTQDQAPAQQLVDVLSPEVEQAVSRAQSSWQLAALIGRLQQQLSRLKTRLDTVVRDMASLHVVALGGVCPPYLPTQKPEPEPQPEPKPEPEPEPEPDCETLPAPLPVDAAPHAEPALRACARSCLQLRDRPAGSPPDGVYWLRGTPVPVYCDFSHDGGGWTLLLTATSTSGWNALSAFARSERSPSLTDNYSILRYADAIRDLGTGARFAYRIETHAQLGRGRWGGVWFAPRHYSFVHESGSQVDVNLVKNFGNWDYKNEGIKKRMPWLNTGARGMGTDPTVLTTTGETTNNWWGTMVSRDMDSTYHHSPWVHPEARDSGTVLYWMREEIL